MTVDEVLKRMINVSFGCVEKITRRNNVNEELRTSASRPLPQDWKKQWTAATAKILELEKEISALKQELESKNATEDVQVAKAQDGEGEGIGTS